MIFMSSTLIIQIFIFSLICALIFCFLDYIRFEVNSIIVHIIIDLIAVGLLVLCLIPVSNRFSEEFLQLYNENISINTEYTSDTEYIEE